MNLDPYHKFIMIISFCFIILRRKMSCQFVGHFSKSHRSTKMFYRHSGKGPLKKKNLHLCLSKKDSWGAFSVVLVIKNLPANARDTRDMGSISGSGRSPGGGHGNPLQYSCLENPTDRGAWRATVHKVTKSRRRLK